MSAPDISPPPEPPPRKGLGGCLAAFLAMVGAVLMLPGLCAIIVAGQGGSGIAGLGAILLLTALAAGGMWLIVWALERR